MPKIVQVPAGIQFRVAYYNEDTQKVEVTEAVKTQSEVLKMAHELLGKNSTRNIEILTLVALMLHEEGPSASGLILPGHA